MEDSHDLDRAHRDVQLGFAWAKAGDPARARTLLMHALPLVEASLSPHHPVILDGMMHLACATFECGLREEAEALFASLRDRAKPMHCAWTVMVLAHHAACAAQAGRQDLANEELRDVESFLDACGDRDRESLGNAYRHLGELHAVLGNPAEAERCRRSSAEVERAWAESSLYSSDCYPVVGILGWHLHGLLTRLRTGRTSGRPPP